MTLLRKLACTAALAVAALVALAVPSFADTIPTTPAGTVVVNQCVSALVSLAKMDGITAVITDFQAGNLPVPCNMLTSAQRETAAADAYAMFAAMPTGTATPTTTPTGTMTPTSTPTSTVMPTVTPTGTSMATTPAMVTPTYTYTPTTAPATGGGTGSTGVDIALGVVGALVAAGGAAAVVVARRRRA